MTKRLENQANQQYRLAFLFWHEYHHCKFEVNDMQIEVAHAHLEPILLYLGLRLLQKEHMILVMYV